MLHLPVELVLWTLAYLPLKSLCTLPPVSRQWKQFFEVNESSIYHNAAILHHFIISSATSFSDLWSIYSERSLIDVRGWKSFCRRRLEIESSWSSKGPSTVTEYPATGRSVHRIKVDEKAGYIITTSKSQQGSLIVSDLARNQVLWSLPQGYVRKFAHCEYGEGYLIFNRRGGTKEVWRRTCDCDDAQETPAVSHPDHRQLRASAQAAQMHISTAPRGHFKPWALLEMPEFTSAFRFVYPTLVVVAWDRAYLWDIPTGRLIQTIAETQRAVVGADGPGPIELLGDINYVEVSERHVFICGTHMIRIFSRASGKCVFDIPSSQFSYANWHYKIVPVNPSHVTPGAILVPHQTDSYFIPPMAENGLFNEFVAVHVSSCGRNLVAMLASSKVVMWYDFERVLRGEVKMRDIALTFQLGSPRSSSKYLAFDDRRIAVATGTGLFVVHPSLESEEALANLESEVILPYDHPLIVVWRAAWFGNPSWLKGITCLQMSDTGLFLNWDPTETLPDFEAHFNQSLMDDHWFRDLPNGHSIVLLENEGERSSSMGNTVYLIFPDPLDRPEVSTVFSVNFVPVPSSLPSS